MVLDAAGLDKLEKNLVDNIWGDAHKEWITDLNYYNRKILFKLPAYFKTEKRVPSTARSLINNATSQLITSEPSVGRRPLSGSDPDKALAGEVGTWAALNLKNLSREAMTPPPKEYAKHLFIYGYSNMYAPTWLDSLWPTGRRTKKRLAKLKGIYPYSTIVPHPSKILLDPSGGKNPPFGIYRTYRLLRDIRDQFGLEDGELPGDDFKRVKTLTFWDKNQYLMTAGGILVPGQDKDNPYEGLVPFFQCFAGFGADTAYEGGNTQTSMADLCVGILRHIRDSLKSEAFISTALDYMMYRWAYQKMYTTEDAEELAEQSAENQIVQVQDVEAQKWEQPPNVPNWVMAMLGERRADSETGTFNEILRGQRQQGVSTASQHAQMTAKAKQIFITPMQQLNHVWSLWTGHAAKLAAEVYKDPVTMQGRLGPNRLEVTMEPEDFQKNYIFDVDFEASDPMERAADIETGIALYSLPGPSGLPPGITWQHLMTRYVKLDDVAAMEEALQIDAAVNQQMASPASQQAIAAEVDRMWAGEVGLDGNEPVAALPGVG